MSNPAARQGWVKSTDPKSGRVFYANHVTRKTQWEPPEGWIEVEAEDSLAFAAPSASQDEDDDQEPLPSNWEVMRDPTTGKPFYVDHEKKITTWTRPKAPKPSVSTSHHSLQPAVPTPPSSGNYAGFGQSTSRNTYDPGHSSVYGGDSGGWDDPYTSSYSFHHSTVHHHDAADLSDWSDALPGLDFSVQSVPDAMRLECPDCGAAFTRVTNRRHHCRLCGDVYCGDCSDTRVVLPPTAAVALRGSASPEEESRSGSSASTPVRVCRACHEDVERGNFFSMRRYFTPLILHEPNNKANELPENAVASSSQVNAALSALTGDVHQMISGLEDTITSIPKETFVTQVCKHLQEHDTADRAIQCIATLLSLEAIVIGNKQTPTWKIALYEHAVQPFNLLDHVVAALERSGSDRKRLYVQEQAAKILFYMTEPKTIAAALQQVSTVSKSGGGDSLENSDNGVRGGETKDHIHPVELLDLHRAIRCILDHASSSSKYVNLQRWSAACLVNLILEDQRRACMAINDAAAMIASGEQPRMDDSGNLSGYTTVMEELISTGGIMMLTTLIGAEDSDTRAHAVAALGATLASNRAIDASLSTLSEMTGGAFGTTMGKDGMIVRAIVAGGGCGTAVAQLLLSAENAVAGMGCKFLSSLVLPLLSDPHGSQTLAANYDYRNDQGPFGACREASIEIVTGSCLPALISLVREKGSIARPIEVRKLGMETLAAIVLSIGNMGSAWAQGLYEAGLEQSNAPSKLKDAILMLNEEGGVDVSLELLQSSSGQSFGSDRETPATRINECAGIILGALTACSAEAIIELQTRSVLPALLLASNDAGMPVQSSLRGDAAPRCLGIVETVSAVLMFAWQHPSGASNELLDRLIELMDAGVIPYLSKVINSKIDWESKDKSVGAMKARTASCKLLCCLFGVALTDPTGIGMRRLMDAIDADSRSYRGGEKAPSNIIESSLGVLQKSLSYARASLLGTLNQGAHYHAAVIDLADAALLAVGSMCGSSTAPSSIEGNLVSGEQIFSAPISNEYAGRIKSVCRVACEIVVRGGKSGPSLIPTMLVGGFGESAVSSSLRLALAIAQNGSPEEHAKLALSGVLVPISDSLRAALSKGDLYKFSASLALVRFCGPHVAAGSSGGVQSVRDAIRVATNVLTLPINPDASVEQLDTQDSLKSECIAALESLSHNASLWSSISSEALPAIVQYLQSTALMKSGTSQRQSTRCAALNAVLKIVRVPSHAVAAAQAGIVEPLSKLLRFGDIVDDVPMLTLEILHVIFKSPEARRKSRFQDADLTRSVCAALGKSATSNPDKPTDSRADVTFLSLELLHSIILDVGSGQDTAMLLSSKAAEDIVRSVASEPRLVRALCATLLLKTNMELPKVDNDGVAKNVFIISDSYGPPLIQVPEKCAGYDGTHEAAAAFLFIVSAMACGQDSAMSETFWNTVLFLGAETNMDDHRLSATFCAHYLALLIADYIPFLPLDQKKTNDFAAITRPLVQHRLVSTLNDLLDELTESEDLYVASLLVTFNVPHIGLSLWLDPVLLDVAFPLTKKVVDIECDEILHLFVKGPAAIESLFDLLSMPRVEGTATTVKDTRQFLATLLADLAESGLLVQAIDEYGMRSKAIQALAKACVNDDVSSAEDDDEDTSVRLATMLMKCLADICSVKENPSSEAYSDIIVNAIESEVIAKDLGRKLCHMVVSRFLERAKLQEYEIDDDHDIMDAPDVAILCAISQHEEAMKILRSVGGLHALSLIAAEGSMSALTSLEKACEEDASILLEGETHVAMMSLIASDREGGLPCELESVALNLLGRLCARSLTGRQAVIGQENCKACITRAIEIVTYGSKKLDLVSDEKCTAEEDKKEDDTELDDRLPPPAYKALVESELARPPFEADESSVSLTIAACSFLSSVLVNSKCLDVVLDDDFVASIASHVQNDNPKILFAALSMFSSLAPLAKINTALSPDKLSEVFRTALTLEVRLHPTTELNANRILLTAAQGVNMIFDDMDEHQQQEIALIASKLFSKRVKLCAVTRATANGLEKQFGAELMYELSTLLHLLLGKSYMFDIINQDLLAAMINLIQWHHDPKTSVGSDDARYWNASISNCLILLCKTLCRPNETLLASGVDLVALSEVSLVLTRPGKAPRKAIDFRAVLQRLAASSDALTSLSAERVMARIFA